MRMNNKLFGDRSPHRVLPSWFGYISLIWCGWPLQRLYSFECVSNCSSNGMQSTIGHPQMAG